MEARLNNHHQNTTLPPQKINSALGADLTGTALAVVEALVDSVVSQALEQAAAASTSTAAAPASAPQEQQQQQEEASTTTATAAPVSEAEDEEDDAQAVARLASKGGSFGYLGGKWCWEWLVVGNASGGVGVGVCTSRASLQVGGCAGCMCVLAGLRFDLIYLYTPPTHI